MIGWLLLSFRWPSLLEVICPSVAAIELNKSYLFSRHRPSENCLRNKGAVPETKAKRARRRRKSPAAVVAGQASWQ